MNTMTIHEASIKWGISERRIRLLCSSGRIQGATKVGNTWILPSDSAKPIDSRLSNHPVYSGLDVDFSKIEELKKAIDAYRPLSRNISKSLKEKLIVDWTYNSNAIEGNTLTLSETKVVLEGLTIGGKSIVEHLEVINHRDAILFIEDLISNNVPLNEWNIKNIHALILKGIDQNNAGRYRNENVLISGATHIPPTHFQVDQLMQQLIRAYETEWNDIHPIIRAMLLHGEFVKIHPFIDGNGRTARLLLNFELMKRGYTPIIIRKDQRPQYYAALDTAHTTLNYEPFLKLICELVIESEKLWLFVLE